MGEGVLTNMYHMLELIKRNSFELEHKNFKKLAYGQEKWIVNALNVFINMRQNKFSFFYGSCDWGKGWLLLCNSGLIASSLIWKVGSSHLGLLQEVLSIPHHRETHVDKRGIFCFLWTQTHPGGTNGKGMNHPWEACLFCNTTTTNFFSEGWFYFSFFRRTW